MKKSDIIRKEIIPDDCPEYVSGYSNIELAGAYSKDKNNFEIFEKLLLKTNKNGQILNKILIRILQHANSSVSIDAIKLLIKRGADVNYSGNQFWDAPIYIGLHLKNIKIIELLIENGADVNKKGYFGCSPLTYFIKNCDECDNIEIIKLLIRKGSQVNYQDNKDRCPLMICLQSKNNDLIKLDIIKLLLDNKADIYIKDKRGKNILNYCENNMYYSLIFNYKNLKNDNFCECDINFIYCIS